MIMLALLLIGIPILFIISCSLDSSSVKSTPKPISKNYNKGTVIVTCGKVLVKMFGG